MPLPKAYGWALAPASDTTPDAFSIQAIAGAERAATYTSSAVIVSGIDAPTTISVVGALVSINGGAFGAPPTSVMAGDQVRLRRAASNSYATAVSAVLNIGGVQATWVITTGTEQVADVSPDQFTFVDVSNADPSTAYVSDPIIVAGINAATSISVTPGGEYSKNGGAWSSAAGTVVNGDSIRARVTSPAEAGTAAHATVTIGDKVDTFTVTTQALPVRAAAAVTIRDATPINFVDGSGWVADVTFKDMAVGGVGDMAGSKALVLTVRGSGYDANGAATTYDRTVKGTVPLRKPAPNQAQFAQVASGADVVVSFALDDFIYAGETIVAASIGAGAYTQGGNSNSAVSSIPVRVNSSALVSPKPICRWASLPLQRATGPTFRVELAVAHPHGRDGRAVACVEYRVEDEAGVDQGISVKSNVMVQSTSITGGNPVPVFAADIPTATLAQGTAYRVRAKASPWVGTSIADSGVDFSAPMADARYASLPFLCDKNGTYGDKVAFVKPAAVGGAVGAASDLAAARATPFPTIAAAAAALRTANNAKAGADQHDNANGSTIYLMESAAGAGADHAGFGLNTMAASTTGYKTWLKILKDPAATGTVRFVTGVQKGGGYGMWFGDGIVFGTAAVAGNANDYTLMLWGAMAYIPLALVGIEYRPTTPASTVARPFDGFGLIYGLNSSFHDGDNKTFGGVASNRTQWAFIGGCHTYGAGYVIEPQVCLGNVFHDGAGIGDANAALNRDTSDGFFVACNSFLKQKMSNGLGNSRAYARGAAIIQNLTEIVTNGLNAAAINLAADNIVNDAVNIVRLYNTDVGDRTNMMYTSSGIAPATVKRGPSRFNISWKWNCKSDVFWVVNEGHADGNDRTGNWAFRHGVSNFGNINTDLASGGGGVGDPAGWLGEYFGRGSAESGTVTFVNPQQKGFGTSAGGGDYHLTGAVNAAYGRVAAGLSALPFDLSGAARRNDGTGAAGCYERTV